MNGSSPRYLTIYVVTYLVFIYVPMLLIPIFSFNSSGIAAFPLQGLTLAWYKALLAERTYQTALVSSLAVAISVAIVSTILGLLAALALARPNLPARGAIFALLALPLLLPPLVIGLSLLTFLRKLIGLELSLVTVAIGHLVLCLPYSIAVLLARLESFDHTILEASLDLGQGPLATFLRITVPLAMPGIVSSLLLTSVVSFDEFVVAFFLTGKEATLPIAIWGSLRFPAKLPITLALGSVILAVTIAIVVTAEHYRRKAIVSDYKGQM